MKTPQFLYVRCLATTATIMSLLAITTEIANAATIPFTFSLTGDATLNGQPSPANTVLGETFSGVGTFAPFGPSVYTDTGTITFGFFPSGFGVVSLLADFTASFNGGADTFSGTSLDIFNAPDNAGAQSNSGALTILQGTGVFAGATGSATAFGLSVLGSPISFTGSGQISAAGLQAVPEPGTIALFGIALAGLLGKAVLLTGGKTYRTRGVGWGTSDGNILHPKNPGCSSAESPYNARF
jgi:hypothetical protein